MAKWFKRTKRGGTTYTTYQDGSKPTTWSQSYKDGSTRTTYTHRGGQVTVTKTTKQGGYTKIEKQVQNKKQRPKKYKAWKPKHSTKWKSPFRPRTRIRTRRSRSQPMSLITMLFWILFAFSPAIISYLKEILNN